MFCIIVTNERPNKTQKQNSADGFSTEKLKHRRNESFASSFSGTQISHEEKSHDGKYNNLT